MSALDDIIYKTMTIRQIDDVEVKKMNSEHCYNWFNLNGQFYEFSFPGADELFKSAASDEVLEARRQERAWTLGAVRHKRPEDLRFLAQDRFDKLQPKDSDEV